MGDSLINLASPDYQKLGEPAGRASTCCSTEHAKIFQKCMQKTMHSGPILHSCKKAERPTLTLNFKIYDHKFATLVNNLLPSKNEELIRLICVI